jgi:ABC-2 type transport system permease protein
MKLHPGSALWLLRHELRMFYYNGAAKLAQNGRRSFSLSSMAVWLVFTLALHAFAGVVVYKVGDGVNALPPETAMAATVMLFALATLMMSMGLRSSVEALFERNDLDLLMSSPLPTRSIFTVRLGVVVLGIAAIYLFFLAPFAHAGLVLGHFRWLGIYPTIISMALLAASLSMLLTLALVRLLGIRRTRVVAQILGALSGAFLFLCTQAYNAGFAPARDQLFTSILPLISPGGPLAADSIAWTPGRALLGSPLASLGMFVLGAAAVWATINTTHRFFAHGVQQAAGAGQAARRPAGETRFHFRQSLLLNVALKEWRSILRDPQLISQILLQLLYLLPLFAVVLMDNDRPLAGIAFGLCLFMSSLTGSLTWLAVSAEDAPDLLLAAPTDMRKIRRAKLFAVVLPPFILSAPVLGWAIAGAPLDGGIMTLAVLGATLSAALIGMWTGKPANRTAFQHRAKGNLLGMMMEMFNSLCWSGAVITLLLPASRVFPQEWRYWAFGGCMTVISLTLLGAWGASRTRAG